jgi:hypothetical protein
VVGDEKGRCNDILCGGVWERASQWYIVWWVLGKFSVMVHRVVGLWKFSGMLYWVMGFGKGQLNVIYCGGCWESVT